MNEGERLERIAQSLRDEGDPLWWQPLGQCRREKADPDLFITVGDRDDDPWYPSPDALRYCNVCPVRVHCLDWALLNKECGTWGGTSEYQRRQLRRTQSRATCPACGAHDIEMNSIKGHEICMSCATSWPTLTQDVDNRKAAG